MSMTVRISAKTAAPDKSPARIGRVLFPLLATLLLAACKVSFNSSSSEPLPPAVAGTPGQRDEAVAAAKDILHDIDGGNYKKVWENSSALLKDSAGEFVFVNLLKTTRGNLGKPKPRREVRIGFTSKIDENAPVGDYCVLEVDTNFDGSVWTEKLVMDHGSGTWKLAGYFMSSKKTYSIGG